MCLPPPAQLHLVLAETILPHAKIKRGSDLDIYTALPTRPMVRLAVRIGGGKGKHEQKDDILNKQDRCSSSLQMNENQP